MKVLLLIFVIGVVAPGSCKDSGPRHDEEHDIAQLNAMETAILQMIGDASCRDSTDCRYIAFGDKPCGGPWGYLVYSVSSVDSVALARAVADYNAFNAELNRRYGWISTCDIPPPPVLGCIDGKCTAVDHK